MQMSNVLSTQTLDPDSSLILNSLIDMAHNIKIQSDFQIIHPNYKPLELPAETISRLKKLPNEIQHNYLNLQLRSFLYGIYYNSSLKANLALDRDPNEANTHQDLTNNTFLNVDLEFYEQLHKNNHGKGHFDPGWTAVAEKSNGKLAVNKGGLTLCIDRNTHLQSTEQQVTIGNLVAIKLPRNFVQNGFYMAVADAGIQSSNRTDSETVRVYFNFSPKGAIAIMSAITQKLNESQISFTFKVLYNPADYNRYDSGVLYFGKSDYKIVHQALLRIYIEHQTFFSPEIPLFTKLLAPGLGLAEEPNIKFGEQESFGMNRCQIIANGFLEAKQFGFDSPKTIIDAILQQFSRLKLDWQKPYLNANSKDIYVPFTYENNRTNLTIT